MANRKDYRIYYVNEDREVHICSGCAFLELYNDDGCDCTSPPGQEFDCFDAPVGKSAIFKLIKKEVFNP